MHIDINMQMHVQYCPVYTKVHASCAPRQYLHRHSQHLGLPQESSSGIQSWMVETALLHVPIKQCRISNTSRVFDETHLIQITDFLMQYAKSCNWEPDRSSTSYTAHAMVPEFHRATEIRNHICLYNIRTEILMTNVRISIFYCCLERK